MAMVAGLGGIAGVAEERILERVGQAPEEPGQVVQVTVRGFSIADAMLLSLWLVYIALGLWVGP